MEAQLVDRECSNKANEMHEMVEKNRRLRNQVAFLQEKQKKKREEIRKLTLRGMYCIEQC
jgi:hypothetical protein